MFHAKRIPCFFLPSNLKRRKHGVVKELKKKARSQHARTQGSVWKPERGGSWVK